MRSGARNLMTVDKQIAKQIDKQIAAEHLSAILTPTAPAHRSGGSDGPGPKTPRPRLRDSPVKPIFGPNIVRIIITTQALCKNTRTARLASFPGRAPLNLRGVFRSCYYSQVPLKGSVGGVRAEAGAAAVRTNEETWLENQEKNTRLRSSRSKRAIIPSNRQFLFSRRSSLPNSMKL